MPNTTIPPVDAATDCSASEEIKQAIIYYESNGWNWLSVVCFLAMRQQGLWPTPIQRNSGRKKQNDPAQARRLAAGNQTDG